MFSFAAGVVGTELDRVLCLSFIDFPDPESRANGLEWTLFHGHGHRRRDVEVVGASSCPKDQFNM